MWFVDWYFELVQDKFGCVIRAEVTLCCWREVKVQELTNCFTFFFFFLSLSLSLSISWRKTCFLFCSCVCLCLYGPFNCISFHKFSRQLSAFSLRTSGLISAFLVLSTIYLFMKVSLSPDIILCGWLGLKHQLTKFRQYVMKFSHIRIRVFKYSFTLCLVLGV